MELKKGLVEEKLCGKHFVDSVSVLNIRKHPSFFLFEIMKIYLQKFKNYSSVVFFLKRSSDIEEIKSIYKYSCLYFKNPLSLSK